MRLVLQLELPADARFLPRTRRVLAGYLDDIGAPAEDADDVVLALDEACVNVIRHAFPNRRDGAIHLRAELSDDEVTVVVEDEGVGFDPLDDAVRDVALEDESGRGLFIIRQLMNRVELESPTANGGTRVSMSRLLHPSNT